MEAAAEISIFQHNLLPDLKAHIRLLKILSVNPTRNIPVHCELTNCAFDETATYIAISYTWGEEAPLKTILVNGKRMDVRQNCEYALKQAGPYVGEGYLWIDAICINQSDNDEKSAQVAMMGDVFKKAKQVFACVGQHKDDSEFLYSMMRKDERRFRSWRSTTLEKGYIGILSIRYYPGLLFWKLRFGKSNIARLRKAFEEFMQRPYFYRVWIYQELCLAQDVGVLCGDSVVPISWIWTTYLVLYSTVYFEWRQVDLDLWCPGPVQPEFGATGTLLQAGATNQPSVGFYDAMTTVKSLQCLDPRDRLYGTMSIIDWQGIEPIQPDYSKDTFDLAIEVMERLYQRQPYTLSYLLIHAQRIGENLRLDESPSKRLTDIIQDRMSPVTQLTTAEPCRNTNKKGPMNQVLLAGLQLSFREGQWRFQQDIGLKHTPKMDRWKNGDTPQTLQMNCGILLPPAAQDGDWLLLRDFDMNYTPVCFLARNHGPDQWELIGKVLIAESSEWSPKCKKLIMSLDTVFRVHLDAEDTFAVISSLDWMVYNPKLNSKTREERVVDQYFSSRLCRQRYSSFVTYERSTEPESDQTS